jgi:hypothetical protein
MPTNIGAENAKFNTLIPQINENADIQTALRLYHYGEGSSGVGSLNPNSIAGFLDELENEKVAKQAQIIPENANLNDYTETGFYSQDTDAKAKTGSNYPEIPPGSEIFYPGMLKVFSDGTNIYQEYQAGGQVAGKSYWRVKFGTSNWSVWRSFAFEGHVHPQYIDRAEADRTYLTAIKFKDVRSPIINPNTNSYTLSREDEDKILLINNGSNPCDVILPLGLTDDAQTIPNGTRITVIQANNGQVTFLPQQSFVSVQATPGNKTRTLWSVAILVKIGLNSWVVYGDLEDSRTRSQRRNVIGIYVQPNEPVGGVQDGDLWFW